jgi:cardiolipin synthase
MDVTASGAGTPSATPYGALTAQLRSVATGGDRLAGDLAPTTGNKLEVIEGAQAYVARLLTDLRSSQREINMSMYALQVGPPGGIADQVVDVLCEKARSGVPVTVQLDAVGSELTPWHAFDNDSHGLVQKLRDAGVEVRIKTFTPTRTALGDARFAVDHRKLIEIDGRVSYQGGINLVDDWASWHDLMLRAEGPAAAQSGALLAARWRDLGGTVTEQRLAVLQDGLNRPVTNSAAGARQLSNGNEYRRQLTDYELGMINDARTSIRVANPYWSDEASMDALVNAAKRGVKVEVLLPPKAGESADILAEPFRRLWAARIQDAGGSVYLLPTFSHAKTIIADGESLIGSLNLDNGATRRNYESAMATRDSHVHAQLSAMFDRQRASATELPPATRFTRVFGRIRDVLRLKY